jgi:5-methylcytosine-specific restriction endonuclease McrA
VSSLDDDALDDSQIAQMTWAADPSNGHMVRLTQTPELEAEYRAWLDSKCRHPEQALRKVKPANASWMYRNQCVTCGRPNGQWVKKSLISDVEAVAEAPLDQLAQYEQRRNLELKRITQKHLEIQDGRGNAEYSAYLKSPIWKAKREKILLRAKGVCEGCGENAASQVHHLSYRHIYNEFLWELVAICDGCHDRVHREILNEQNGQKQDDGDESGYDYDYYDDDGEMIG